MNRPYLVSALVQLADVTAKAVLFLIQDLSSIPPSVAPLYIREFEARVSQERSWTAANLDRFLTIRSAIGSLASEVSAATPAFAVMIEVLKKAQ